MRFTTDGKETKARSRATAFSTAAKWEGSALLVNIIVNGDSFSYTQMDHWRLSRDGATLTIGREIVGRAHNAEAALVYGKEGAAVPPAPVRPAQPASPPAMVQPQPKPVEYAVEAGTRIPLTLINSVSTKQSSEGDRVYLTTVFPILQNGRIVIPPGSYVAGTLTFVKRPGRIRGRGELYLRFDSLTLPNGVTRDFRSRLGGLDGDTEGTLDRQEGNIKGEGHKGQDARTVAEAASAGASVGGIAGAVGGSPGLGVGAGAAAGTAAGIMAVLLSRGPDLVLARGMTLEMVLDRKLVFSGEDLGTGWRRAQ